MTADDVAAMNTSIARSQSILEQVRSGELAMLTDIQGGHAIRFADGVVQSRSNGGIYLHDTDLCNQLREFLIVKLSELAGRKASEVVATIAAYQLGATAQQISEMSSPNA